jgi:hypothetical protein
LSEPKKATTANKKDERGNLRGEQLEPLFLSPFLNRLEV